MRLYQTLSPIRQFGELADLKHFIELDDTWSVIASDIQGSTKAIESGRYKEVNLLGAATIAAIRNSIGTRDFPFVFGGDGASVVLPHSLCEKVIPELRRLKSIASSQFQIELRIGIVPMSKIRSSGAKIAVAKYEISPGSHIAMFQGGGLQAAEKLIKAAPELASNYLLSGESSGPPSLKFLSCRWAPIESRNGTIASLIVQATSAANAHETYRAFLSRIDPLFVSETFRPVSEAKMRNEPFSSCLRREIRFRQDLGPLGISKIFFQMIIARTLHRFGFFPGGSLFRKYLRDSMANSDYKKFDDTLRMVLDCDPEQLRALELALSEFHKDGKIYYGIFRSKAALMTCMMEGLSSEQHLHFIDGCDGGYAMAAKQLKSQIAASQLPPASSKSS